MPNKKLSNLTISHSVGRVGISLFYEDHPAEHVLLPLSVAMQVRDKFIRACDLAGSGRTAGDDIMVSDRAAMSIVTPKRKEH